MGYCRDITKLVFDEIETTTTSNICELDNGYDEVQIYVDISGTGTGVWKIELIVAFDSNDTFVQHYSACNGVQYKSSTGNISSGIMTCWKCTPKYAKFVATLVTPPEGETTSKLTLKYEMVNKF